MQKWFNNNEARQKINQLGSLKRPFLFVFSFDKTEIFIQPLDNLDSEIYYKLEESRNYTPPPLANKPHTLEIAPPTFEEYSNAFNKVIWNIKEGNTYLLNLTFPSQIKTNLTLKEIFFRSKAKFKLYFKGEFICFSPERFIQIQNDTISTYPMKGTIDATLPNAKDTILNNEKELAEHVMIVDLMRNDLGIVGSDVKVERFRYIDKIQTGNKPLLQVSSKITASLEKDWHSQIGDILCDITPAGSVTGTPKRKTTQIIEEIEGYQRGFYTGIFGIYDGCSLNSSVMIRFIDKQDKKLYYKSGGGITIESDLKKEYDELIEKIYLPF